jgi:flagellar biosynthetic protein FliR
VSISVNYTWLAAFLLAFARSIAWLINVPPFSSRAIPRIATTAAGAGLALLVEPSIPVSSVPTDFTGLLGSLIFQLFSGFALGFLVNVLLSTAAAAGGLLDLLGGLNLPAAIDPLGLDQKPILGQFYEQVMIVLLFASGGYLYIIRGFMRSFSLPGFSLGSTNRVALVLITDVSTFFASALEMAAPVLVVLFATQIVLGMLSKAAPQINVWVMGMPLQIFLSLVLISISITALPNFVMNITSRIIGDMGQLFGSR